ncbi:adenylate isopentenyltransferase 1 chloroplastic [Phtheirospermum japonicum]|uniref:Adenylate isopentenyltransferase 1 chloroplastic n=1 Tax=Phtheirospermum japonicum TaxID=374723 RepID=A0A830BVD0_9LAMI|nr:adenylate isopentenyltransferase 1 chloroplastic [Phtheirospermum japonicum]
MGPTGCGKSKLSVNLAFRFFPSSELINSNKIQIYRDLDITRNKTPPSDRKNVPHHLLGDFHPTEFHPEFTAADFRSTASAPSPRSSPAKKCPSSLAGLTRTSTRCWRRSSTTTSLRSSSASRRRSPTRPHSTRSSGTADTLSKSTCRRRC